MFEDSPFSQQLTVIGFPPPTIAKGEEFLNSSPFHCLTYFSYAVAGLFGVIGGRIGFLNGEVASSAFSSVPLSSNDVDGWSPFTGRPAIARFIWARSSDSCSSNAATRRSI